MPPTDAFSAYFAKFLVGKILTAPMLTQSQHNYSPGSSDIIILTSNVALTISGMLAGYSGERRRIMNTGPFTMTFTHEDTQSNAPNRLLNKGAASIALAQYDQLDAWYNPWTARWHCVELGA